MDQNQDLTQLFRVIDGQVRNNQMSRVTPAWPDVPNGNSVKFRQALAAEYEKALLALAPSYAQERGIRQGRLQLAKELADNTLELWSETFVKTFKTVVGVSADCEQVIAANPELAGMVTHALARDAAWLEGFARQMATVYLERHSR